MERHGDLCVFGWDLICTRLAPFVVLKSLIKA